MRHTYSDIKMGWHSFWRNFVFCACIFTKYLWIIHPIQRYFANKQMHKIKITNRNDLLLFFSPHWLRSSRHFQHTWLLFNFFRQVMQPHLNDTLKRPLTCFLHSFWNMFQPFDLQGKCLYFNLYLFLKVRKSQKRIVMSSSLLKTNEKFLEALKTQKFPFEISWP